MNKQLGDFLTIDDFEVAGRTVLFRADINSVVVDGRVEMKERIQENAKTIRELSERVRGLLFSPTRVVSAGRISCP